MNDEQSDYGSASLQQTEFCSIHAIPRRPVKNRSISLSSALLVIIAVTLSDDANSREAQYFGFGNPPTYDLIHNVVKSHLEQILKDPDSVKDFAISRPSANCFKRGWGKRDVCGYRFCVAYNAKNSYGAYAGRDVFEYWLTKGFGLQYSGAQGECPISFQNWTGTPAVTHQDFCNFQPEHPDCLAGRKEVFEVSETTPNLDVKKAETEEMSLCSSVVESRMRERGISEVQIAEICRAL